MISCAVKQSLTTPPVELCVANDLSRHHPTPHEPQRTALVPVGSTRLSRRIFHVCRLNNVRLDNLRSTSVGSTTFVTSTTSVDSTSVTPRFLTTFDFDREYLRNYSRYPKSERNVIDSDSSRVARKKSGELWSTNKKVLLARATQVDFFGETIFQPYRGCCALKFIHALEIAQALIAHTQSGTGVPPKNLSVKI